MSNTEFVREHPNLPRRTWAQTIPIGFHGDGGAFSKQDSVYVMSWSSLTQAHAATLDSRFLFTVIRSKDMLPNTLDKLMEAFSWSLNQCLRGETDTVDWCGVPIHGATCQPLCGDFRAALCQCRGDLEFLCKLFHFPKWMEADNCCPFCRASNSNPRLLWSNVRPDAPWRGTLWTHAERMHFLRTGGFAIPALFVFCIGFTLSCVHIDSLHTMELGMSAHVAANVMWHIAIVRSAFGGTVIAEKIKLLNDYLQKWYKTSGCVRRIQGPLTLERLRTSKNWPKLKAKGAAVRHLCGFLVHIMETFGDFSHPTNFDHRILAICKLLERYYQILDASSQFLSDDAKIEMRKLGILFASLYAGLAKDAFDAGIRMWKMQPKLHLFEHLTEYFCQERGNPAYYWTYMDEDLVGNMIEVCHSVHVACLAISVLFKWSNYVFQ